MRDQALFDKIDLHLIRVLHTVLTERSVSRAAVRLGMHQPAVSAALKRLRDLSGDPLLVRSGASMMPTDAALRMVEPAGAILRSAAHFGAAVPLPADSGLALSGAAARVAEGGADAVPLVLDNLIATIRPASARPDLAPVFSFNTQGVFVGGANQASTPVDRLSRWRELLLRMRTEGYVP